MNGRLFVNWRKFRHPQLGDVEIGGWEPKFGMQNPPVELLEEECRKNGLFCLDMASMAPQLALEKAVSIPLENGLYKVEAVVKNQGYLPSHGTFSALKMNKAETVKISICLTPEAGCSPGAEGTCEAAADISLIAGKAQEDLGHLGGRAGGGDYKKKVSWVVRGRAGSPVVITVRSGKAGNITQEIRL